MKSVIRPVIALIAALSVVACGTSEGAKRKSPAGDNSEVISVNNNELEQTVVVEPTADPAVTLYSNNGQLDFISSTAAPVNGIKNYFAPGGDTLKLITIALDGENQTFGFVSTRDGYRYFENGVINQFNETGLVEVTADTNYTFVELANLYGVSQDEIFTELARIAVVSGNFGATVSNLDWILEDSDRFTAIDNSVLEVGP